MSGKIFKTIAASIALGTVIYIGTEVAMARVGGGGGHIGSVANGRSVTPGASPLQVCARSFLTNSSKNSSR
jgi:hypothetical protein